VADLVLVALTFLTAFFAIRVVFSAETVSSALSLVMVFVCLSGIYGMIGAHFLAVMQLIIYAGAIMVLFIFAIMLLNLGRARENISLTNKSHALKVFFSLLIFLFFSRLIISGRATQGLAGDFTPEKINEYGGNLKTISYAILSTNIAIFEIISILILVALVGAVILGKRTAK